MNNNNVNSGNNYFNNINLYNVNLFQNYAQSQNQQLSSLSQETNLFLNNNQNLYDYNILINDQSLNNNQIPENNPASFSHNQSTHDQQETSIAIHEVYDFQQDANDGQLELMNPQPIFKFRFRFSNQRKESQVYSHNREVNSLIKKMFACFENNSRNFDFVRDFSKYQPRNYYGSTLKYIHLFDFFKVYRGDRRKIQSAIRILETMAKKHQNEADIYYRLGNFSLSSHRQALGDRSAINYFVEAAFKGNSKILDEMLNGFDLQKRLLFFDRMVERLTFFKIEQNEFSPNLLFAFLNFILESNVIHANDKGWMNSDEKITKFSCIIKKLFEHLIVFSKYESDELRRLYCQSMHLLRQPIINKYLSGTSLSNLALCYYNDNQIENNVNLAIELWVRAAYKDEDYIGILKLLKTEEKLVFVKLFKQNIHLQKNMKALKTKLSTILTKKNIKALQAELNAELNSIDF